MTGDHNWALKGISQESDLNMHVALQCTDCGKAVVRMTGTPNGTEKTILDGDADGE